MPSSFSDRQTADSSGNRLRDSSSPYLLQHADNPVDWYPWGEEAFSRASSDDLPIFLSIGYSACHWCHVMERESFEDEGIAALLNRHFVAIKVDREERPDIDAIYMRAVQMLTGSGGWPMSVFLTPDLRPFYGGTYFPPDDRYGRPGFRRVLLELARLWNEDRSRLEENAGKLMDALSSPSALASSASEADERLLQKAEDRLLSAHDREHGGFGGAPKFPPSMAVRFLLERYGQTGRDELIDIVTHTLDRIAAGGIHDHLGGGFHRYSVDEQWLVPHFEKMLYDNALLSVAYIEAAQLTGNPDYADVAAGCLGFLLREMRDDSGGFHSTLDADSEGEEGRYYVWGHDEIGEVLGEDDAEIVCRLYGVTENGNFEGRNILHVFGDPAAVREQLALEPAQFAERIASMKQSLYAHRSQRVRPHKDDKILASWNGLALSAFARAAQRTGNSDFLEAARGIVTCLRTEFLRDGRLIHSWRRGTPGALANLDDYAYVSRGLIDLFETEGNIRDLELADHLAGVIVVRFTGDRSGDLYFTEDGRKHLISRERCDSDSALPSPAAAAAEVLLDLARLMDRPHYEDVAEAWVKRVAPAVKRAPYGYMSALRVIDALLSPAREIVLAGQLDSAEAQALRDVVQGEFLPNTLFIQWDPQSEVAERVSEMVPLVRGRTAINGAPAAYVCRQRTCQAPVTAPDALAESLREHGQ